MEEEEAEEEEEEESGDGRNYRFTLMTRISWEGGRRQREARFFAWFSDSRPPGTNIEISKDNSTTCMARVLECTNIEFSKDNSTDDDVSANEDRDAGNIRDEGDEDGDEDVDEDGDEDGDEGDDEDHEEGDGEGCNGCKGQGSSKDDVGDCRQRVTNHGRGTTDQGTTLTEHQR